MTLLQHGTVLISEVVLYTEAIFGTLERVLVIQVSIFQNSEVVTPLYTHTCTVHVWYV